MYKFGELASNNLGVYAAKMHNFGRDSAQFDDDLHLSPWRSETDWKIVILILQYIL